MLVYSVEVNVEVYPLDFTTAQNCVLLFVGTNLSVFLASTELK